MTRINVGIPPKELSGRHLIAEHREIKRIPNLVKKKYKEKIEKYQSVFFEDLPKQFTLGKGHVIFFYNKLAYIITRYRELYQECINRGYKVQNYESAFEGIPLDFFGGFQPTLEDIELIKQRMKENADRKSSN